MPKLKNVQRYAKISDTAFDQRSLIHREAWFPPCYVRKNQQKKTFSCAAILDHFQTKMFKCQTTSFHFFPQGFRISKNIAHLTLGRPLKGTSKVNRWTDRHTDGQTDGHFDLQKASAQGADALKTARPGFAGALFRYINILENLQFFLNLPGL